MEVIQCYFMSYSIKKFYGDLAILQAPSIFPACSAPGCADRLGSARMSQSGRGGVAARAYVRSYLHLNIRLRQVETRHAASARVSQGNRQSDRCFRPGHRLAIKEQTCLCVVNICCSWHAPSHSGADVPRASAFRGPALILSFCYPGAVTSWFVFFNCRPKIY
ncbi:hypothetical protein J6590_019126 [Homalodisca vitripennis]|nr:hypothetical protein J6590_019126 [Homalodisca vitripennis]